MATGERVLELFKGRDGLVRAALIKTAYGNTRHPLQKLVALEAAGLEEQERTADSAQVAGPADSTEAVESQALGDDEAAANQAVCSQVTTNEQSDLARKLAETLEFVREKKRDLASHGFSG